jgi:hypothetical protein
VEIVKPNANKSWQFGPASATLLVAYLLVLQGLAVGFAVGARSGFFPGSICLSNSSASSEADPSAPARQHHPTDICCVLHCSGMGDATVAEFASQTPPPQLVAERLTPFSWQVAPARPATPPLGSRAPPSIAS